MVILYNPKSGSKIEEFVFERVGKLAPHDVGEIKQYESDVAEALKKIFPFLEVVTPQKAEEIINKPKEAQFKCEYCDFSTDHKVALAGHKRSHQAEIAKDKEPVIDPTIIPVAEATPVSPNKTVNESRIPEAVMSGPDWYGPGLTEEKSAKGIGA